MMTIPEVAAWIGDWSLMTPAIVVKATVLLLIAAIASALMRRASAGARHAVWHLTLLALVALPVLAPVVPSWRLTLPAAPAAVEAQGDPAGNALPAFGSRLSAGSSRGPRAERREPQTSLGTTDPVQQRPDLRGSIGLVWAVGALAVLGWLLVGHLWLGRVTRRSRLVTDATWLGSVQEVSGRLDLRRPVTVLRSEAAATPATCGLLWPSLLLPAAADGWPADHRTSVLCHELAHVKRFDCLTQVVAQLACALFWFHPGVWYAARRLVVERERACDDVVLALGARPSDYASHLIAVARALRPTRLATTAAVCMARHSQLEGRLLAVLDPDRRRADPARRFGRAPVVAMLAIVLPLAALSPAKPSTESPASPTHTFLVNDGVAVSTVSGSGAAIAPGSAPGTPIPLRAGLLESDDLRVPETTSDCAATAEHMVRVPLADARRVRIDAGAGGVQVLGRTGLAEIRVRGVACAADGGDLDEVWLRADRDGRTVEVESLRDRRDQKAALRLVVEIPVDLEVEIEDANGDIEIRDVARLRVDEGSGHLRVARVRGGVWVDDIDGDVIVRDVEGTVTVNEHRAGNVDVAGVRGDFEVERRGSGAIAWRDVDGRVRVPSPRARR